MGGGAAPTISVKPSIVRGEGRERAMGPYPIPNFPSAVFAIGSPHS
jgi:hypothetical protein